jgi:hypothetical protein
MWEQSFDGGFRAGRRPSLCRITRTRRERVQGGTRAALIFERRDGGGLRKKVALGHRLRLAWRGTFVDARGFEQEFGLSRAKLNKEFEQWTGIEWKETGSRPKAR